MGKTGVQSSGIGTGGGNGDGVFASAPQVLRRGASLKAKGCSDSGGSDDGSSYGGTINGLMHRGFRFGGSSGFGGANPLPRTILAQTSCATNRQ